MKWVHMFLVLALVSYGSQANATEHYDSWGMWAHPINLAELLPPTLLPIAAR